MKIRTMWTIRTIGSEEIIQTQFMPTVQVL